MLILAVASTILMFCFVPLYFENQLPFKHVVEKKIGLNPAYFGGVLMNESGQEVNEKWLSELFPVQNQKHCISYNYAFTFCCDLPQIVGEGGVTHPKIVTVRRIRKKKQYYSQLHSDNAMGHHLTELIFQF
jgi:hypothetical protein